jgi:hypothetical protein
MNLLKWFSKKYGVYNTPVKTTDAQKRELFERMLDNARQVINMHEKRGKRLDGQGIDPVRHPIFDFIKLAGLRLQTHYITNLLYAIEGKRLPNIDYWHMMFSNSNSIEDGKMLYDFLLDMPNDDMIVCLKKDLVLPWPWNQGRLLNSLVNIGEGRNWGEWKEDSLNHNVEMWLPMRIAFVSGGNHSLSTGILQGEGTIKPNYVMDISPLYKVMYTDGVNYYRMKDKSILGPVLNVEFAVIFEIGRLMVSNDLVSTLLADKHSNIRWKS